MRGSGGTDGGVAMFLIGAAMAIGGAYFFFDSVYVRTGHSGMITGMLRGGGGGGGMIETTSMGIIFVPFFGGVFWLFFNSSSRFAWALTIIGVLILAIEIVSRIRFFIDTKLTHLLIMLVMMAGGGGLIFRSFRDMPRLPSDDDSDSGT
ncbi:MAG: hypothetical protein AAFP90_04255 [Planctomycetota bacterium]